MATAPPERASTLAAGRARRDRARRLWRGAGHFLGVSEGTYLVLSALGIIGGIGAGFDHLGAAAGAKRGLLAGSIFGAAILIAHEVHGATAKADLPDPEVPLVVITALLGMAFGAAGGRLRARGST